MNDLIPISQNDDGTIAVSGRALHAGLEVATNYTTWFKRMADYGLIEGEDYVSTSGTVPTGRADRSYEQTDHALTLDAAKEIAMVQRTERGQEIRRYFIAAEKRLREVAAPQVPRTYAEALRAAADAEEEKLALAATIEQQKPMADYHERFISEQDDIVTVDNFAGQYGSTGPTVRGLLADSGLAARKLVGKRWSRSKGELEKVYEWRSRQGLATSEWFDLRPQHDAPRLHNGQVRQTLYIRQYYAEQLAVKLGLAQPAFAIPA
ncbi:MAG: antA/AntB antirepressor family protein [Brachybacterium tyrofermentans]|uniref:antA/AntB antirepressor family protein n=1 Tax=Brachybacterium tyrofermentans TaxID=47848 RepID=UPI0018668F10|nr:antA/AntB antirepressor family protein [Brachybacterium tyrofermentans]